MSKTRRLLIFAVSWSFLLWGAQVQAASWFGKPVEIVPVHEGELIQAAVNRSKKGDVILVSAGIYYEIIKLKEGITLRSESGPEQTTINGNHGSGTVVQMAENSTLDGFTVTGRGGEDKAEQRHAVECLNVSATVKNNVVRDNDGTGIYVAGKNANAKITGNRVFDNLGAGIGVSDYSKAHLLGNQCYGNKEAGIGIQAGASPLVENNKCFQNQKVGIGARDKESNPVLQGNECYNNELSGVGLQRGVTATLKNNHLHNNGRSGVGIRDASKAIIEENKIEKNTLSGIGSLNKSVLTVKGNLLQNNTMSGLTVMDGSKAVIEDNTIKANGTQGIVCSAAQVTVKNNQIIDHVHHGIGLYRDAKAEINHNVINNNGANDKRGAGILVVSSNKPVIQHNEFTNNYGPGVYTRLCTPLIEENVFTNDLIFVKFHASPTIRKNVFYSAGKSGGKTVKSGVDVRKSSHPIIADNEFYGKFAVAVREDSHPLIFHNKFSGSHKNSIKSGRSGVKIDRTSHPSVIDNIFYNDNKILASHKSITKNVIITRGRTGRDVSVKMAGEVKPEEHGGKTVVIAGNLFVGARTKKGK